MRIPCFPLLDGQQNREIFIFKELQELYIADIERSLGCALASRVIFIELTLTSRYKLQVIRIASLGYLDNRYLGQLLKKQPLLFISLRRLGLDQLQFQVLFKEQGDSEEVEVGRREHFGGDDDADLSHIDGKFEDQVRQGHK